MKLRLYTTDRPTNPASIARGIKKQEENWEGVPSDNYGEIIQSFNDCLMNKQNTPNEARRVIIPLLNDSEIKILNTTQNGLWKRLMLQIISIPSHQ